MSLEQGDRLLAATGPGKNRCGGPHGSGNGKLEQPWEPQQTNSLGSGARGRGDRRLLPGVPGRMKMPQRYRPLQREW